MTAPITSQVAHTAKARYEQLRVDRSPYEQRAREVAEVTIPTLYPPEGTSSATTFHTPWQSVGARGINNLAAKLLLALFPPGSSFFRLTPDADALRELEAAAPDQDVTAIVAEGLSRYEQRVLSKLEVSNIRSVIFETLRHLLCSGNGLLYVLPNANLKFFPLSRFVCKRDLDGNVIEIVTEEALSRNMLPDAAREIVARSNDEAAQDPTKSLSLFTHVRLSDTGQSWESYQEILGERIPGTESVYPKDKSAWLPLRWQSVANEDYSRGFAEEYLGDLLSLDGLSKALVDGAAGAARLLFMVDEGGVTQKKDIAQAANLDVIDGNAKDVSVLRAEKVADFSVAKQQADEIKQRLEQAFMLTSSIQRNAERVTAEEIRTMAAELEQSLGGAYSVLAQELQRPLVMRVLAVMQRAKELPPLPDKSVQPQIVTGLEGLGRTTDLTKLDVFLSGVANIFGPEAITEYVNPGAYMARRAAALGIDVKGMIRSEEEVQAARQQQMAARMAEKLGPQAIKANADRSIAAQQQEAAAQPQE